MKSYSQCGQDIFVASIIDNPGTFLDLGCFLPQKINNTMLLEELGWEGLSIDIINYSIEWQSRNTKFMNADCLNIDLKNILQEYFKSNTIDYLTLDMEKLGDRFKLLKRTLDTGFKFKIVTIEHDSHIGKDYEIHERDEQRKLLLENGYFLLCEDVAQKQYPTSYFEDWWINPEFINLEKVNGWKSKRLSFDKIFEKMNIVYTIDTISQSW